MNPTPSTLVPDAQGSTLDVMAVPDFIKINGLELVRVAYGQGGTHVYEARMTAQQVTAALSRLAPAAEASGLADAVRIDLAAGYWWEPYEPAPAPDVSFGLMRAPDGSSVGGGMTRPQALAFAATLSAQTGGADAAAGGASSSEVQAALDRWFDAEEARRAASEAYNAKLLRHGAEGIWPARVQDEYAEIDRTDKARWEALTALTEAVKSARLTPASGVDAPVVGEPVAWRARDKDWAPWNLYRDEDDACRDGWMIVEPLYAAPSASRPTVPDQSGDATEMVGRPADRVREAAGPDVQDTTWFWEIVDRAGLADVPSDERGALALLCQRAALATPDGEAAAGVDDGVTMHHVVALRRARTLYGLRNPESVEISGFDFERHARDLILRIAERGWRSSHRPRHQLQHRGGVSDGE